MQLTPDQAFIDSCKNSAKGVTSFTNQAWIRVKFLNALKLAETKSFYKKYESSGKHAEEQAAAEAKSFITQLGSGNKILRIDVVTLKSPCASRCKEPLKDLRIAANSKKAENAEFEIYANSLFTYEVDEMGESVLEPGLKWEETKLELTNAGWNVTQGF